MNPEPLMVLLLKQHGLEEMKSKQEVMLLMIFFGKHKHQSHSKKYQRRPGYQIKFAHSNLVHSNLAHINLAHSDLAPSNLAKIKGADHWK